MDNPNDISASPSEDLFDQLWVRAVMESAVRLLDDADLLARHERFATATSLCILALEEVGKIALRLFGPEPDLSGMRGRSNIHVKKQLAATSLLQAAFCEKFLIERFEAWGIAETDPRSDEQNAELCELLAIGIASSREMQLLEYVRLGSTERVKQMGMYADEWHLEFGFKPGGVPVWEYEALSWEGRRALTLLVNPRVIRFALAIYNLELLAPHVAPSVKLERRQGGAE
jgi:AbiV family abortive infection protein